MAPFSVHLVGLGKNDDETAQVDEIYDMLVLEGIDVLYDDRKASPGFKFADADLVGIPVRLTVGKTYFNDGDIEVKVRSEKDITRVKKEDLLNTLGKII